MHINVVWDSPRESMIVAVDLGMFILKLSSKFFFGKKRKKLLGKEP